MTPVDPDLLEYLERSSERSVEAVGRLEAELGAARRALDDARRAQDEDRRLEVDRFKRLHDRIDELEADVVRIDARCGALVIEEDDEDGQTVIRARPARVGLDAKFVVGALLTLVTAGVVPVLIVYLGGAHP